MYVTIILYLLVVCTGFYKCTCVASQSCWCLGDAAYALSLYATRYLDDPDMRMAEAPRFREAAGLNFLVVALAGETYVTIILDTY